LIICSDVNLLPRLIIVLLISTIIDQILTYNMDRLLGAGSIFSPFG
jgi:hypothetical protein